MSWTSAAQERNREFCAERDALLGLDNFSNLGIADYTPRRHIAKSGAHPSDQGWSSGVPGTTVLVTIPVGHLTNLVLNKCEIDDTNASDKPATSVGIADVIAGLKRNLSLPTKDIAAIMDVSRQTLYSYQKSAEADQTMNESTKARAMELHALVDEIRQQLPKSPGPLAKNIVSNGQSLFDLLRAQTIDREAVMTVAGLLKERMQKSIAAPSARQDDQALRDLTRTT